MDVESLTSMQENSNQTQDIYTNSYKLISIVVPVCPESNGITCNDQLWILLKIDITLISYSTVLNRTPNGIFQITAGIRLHG